MAAQVEIVQEALQAKDTELKKAEANAVGLAQHPKRRSEMKQAEAIKRVASSRLASPALNMRERSWSGSYAR